MLQDLLTRTLERREQDAKRYRELDMDSCILCDAYGADKRSLFIDCLYDISEVIPEAIDLHGCGESLKNRGWYLRICKSCRGALLAHLLEWRTERAALRGLPKGHDGGLLEEDEEATIPIRAHGTTVMMTEEQYEAYEFLSEESSK